MLGDGHRSSAARLGWDGLALFPAIALLIDRNDAGMHIGAEHTSDRMATSQQYLPAGMVSALREGEGDFPCELPVLADSPGQKAHCACVNVSRLEELIATRGWYRSR